MDTFRSSPHFLCALVSSVAAGNHQRPSGSNRPPTTIITRAAKIHFVENGRRLTGVLVAATEGFDNPLSASWRTVLVPTTLAPTGGPVRTDEKPNCAAAIAMANLDGGRNIFYVGLKGDLARERFKAPAAWVLGTDPFVLGLPAGHPQRCSREYAEKETGASQSIGAVSDFGIITTRYVVPGELPQPLAVWSYSPPTSGKRIRPCRSPRSSFRLSRLSRG